MTQGAIASIIADADNLAWVNKKFEWLVGVKTIPESTKDIVMGWLWRSKMGRGKCRMGKKYFSEPKSFVPSFPSPGGTCGGISIERDATWVVERDQREKWSDASPGLAFIKSDNHKL